LTNNGNVNHKDTVLSENDVLITKQDEVCEMFNNFFVNVAKNIGNNQINVDRDHPSILEINDKFTISVSGLTIIGLAKWSSYGEMPSIPVAFFTFILLIRFSTKSGFIEEKEKLFSSNSGNHKDTVLSENDVLITKQDEVCEMFNNFFVNVAKSIGNNQINVDRDHPSILEIKK
jgi:uncharacterized protein YmfQ (DUF2313 family)